MIRRWTMSSLVVTWMSALPVWAQPKPPAVPAAPAAARIQTPAMPAPAAAVATPAAPVPAPPVPAPPAAAPPVAGAVPPTEEPLGEDEAMVLNFEKADIREVIHSLATALGLSYTIDRNIVGDVTIRTTGRIPRRELPALFNQILRANGIAAVKQGDLVHIVPVDQAKARAVIPRSGVAQRSSARDDDFVIEILSMRHMAAEEMANILSPFLTPGGEIFSYPRANTVVVVDLQSNVARLRDLATTFDIDGFSNLRARVYKLKEGDPEEMTNEILSLLGPYGAGTGDGSGGLFMIPLYRLNSIVAFAYDPSAFVEIERWLTLLDIPPEKGSGRQTFVYNVENAKAVDLAAVLNELFGGDDSSGGQGGLGRNAGAAPAGIGLFGAGGTSGARGNPRSGGGASGGRLQSGGGGGGRGAFGGAGGGGGAGGASFGQAGAQVGGLGGPGRSATAAGGAVNAGGGGPGGRGPAGGALAGAAATGAGGRGTTTGGVLGVSLPGGTQAMGTGALGGGGPGQLTPPPGPPPIFKQEVRIVADEVTNSLVVLATRRDYQLILDILKRIDVVPRQVVLEVMIAEVVLGKGLEFGVSYAFSDGSLKNALPPSSGSDGTSGSSGTTRVEPTSGTDLFNVLEPAAGFIGTAARVPASGGAFAVLKTGTDFQIFINALQARTNVKMLAAPHVIAADNREAYILVGQSIPILTSSSQSTLGNSNIVNSVQYRDTGKILTVLPQVNSKGLVNLQIRQEVSAVLETREGQQTSFGTTGSPAFSTREVDTTLVVNNGETVLMGGIIDDTITHTRAGVPYLMDIPILGWAFRSERNISARTELLITITPYVVRNREEAAMVTEDFSSRIDGLRELQDAMRARRHIRATSAGSLESESLEGVPVDERR